MRKQIRLLLPPLHIWQQSFHPGVVGDLPFSLTEHNIRQQIFVPSGLLPLSVIMESQKSGRNTEQQPCFWRFLWPLLVQDNTWGIPAMAWLELWTSWKMQSDCLPEEFLVKLIIICVPLCSLITWKCVSQHHVYHLFQVILLLFEQIYVEQLDVCVLSQSNIWRSVYILVGDQSPTVFMIASLSSSVARNAEDLPDLLTVWAVVQAVLRKSF